MSSDPHWLQSLQQATTYGQLQEAFDQMSLAVANRGVDQELAASIDEAIRRIEQERIRDQAELSQFQAEYDAFKSENSGVVGWFKRKLPFTATRKQDVELRDSVRDQEAEILADNFVIARAQMLKESLLPPDLARLGKPNSYYRNQFALYDSVSQLRQYGQVLVEAGRDVPTAKQFLTQLQTDIDAFAAARFVEKDDQQLQKSGLEKARAELSGLSVVVEDKHKLITAGEERLRHLVEQELAANDPAFHALQRHLHQLQEFVTECDSIKPILDARTQLLEQLKQKLNLLSDMPAKIKSVEAKAAKLHENMRDGQHELQNANAEHQPLQQRYAAARQAAEQAKLRVEATLPLVNAYLAEQGLDLNSISDAPSSSILVEYEGLKAAAASGETQLQQVATQYEPAQRRLQAAQAELDKLTKLDRDVKSELNKLTQDRTTLEGEIFGLCDRYRMAKLNFQTVIGNWLSKKSQLSWQPGLGATQPLPSELLEDLFGQSLTSAAHTHRDPWPLKRITDAMARLNDQFLQALKAAKSGQQQLVKDRLTALQQRSHLLLDSELAERLFA